MTPDPPVGDPMCRECGCRTGGGEYCYQHAPYTVWPLKDGSFRSDRNGMKHIFLVEPPSLESEPPKTGDQGRASALTPLELDMLAALRMAIPILQEACKRNPMSEANAIALRIAVQVIRHAEGF